MADFPLLCTLDDARHSLELAESMLQRARAMWENANRALHETQAMRRELHAQIEDLATRGVFHREFTTTLLAGILDATIEGTAADMGNIQLLDPEKQRLQIHVQRGFERPFLDFFNSVREGQAACGTALKTGRRITVPDVANSSVFPSPELVEALLDAGVRAVQSTPIVGRSGRFWGMLSTHYRNITQPAPKDLQLIDYYASWAAALLEADHRAAHPNDRPSVNGDDRAQIPSPALPLLD